LSVTGNSPPAENQDVHIWYCLTESLAADAIEAAISVLSDEERDRSKRFVFPADRRDFIVAHALTRRALAAHGGLAAGAWEFEVNEHGKPHVARAVAEWIPISFNLSHTRGLVGCAVTADADIGFDVESIAAARKADSFARRYFAPNEVEFLDRCSTTERSEHLINLWTLKEAYIKAVGQGLSHPLHTFSFAFRDDDELQFEAPSESNDLMCHFALFAPADQYRMAVAVRGSSSKTLTLHTCLDEGRPAAPRLLRRTSRCVSPFRRT
jgi:4'-phosphopantetheinyl transferase